MFIKRKIHADRHLGGLRVAPLGWLKSLKWRQFSRVPAIILLCLAPGPYLFWLRALLYVCVHLLAKMDSSVRVSGRLTKHVMAYCSPPEEPSCAYMVWEFSLTLRMRNRWPLYSLYRAYPSLFLLVLLSWSVYRRQSQAAYHTPVIIFVSKHKEEANCLSWSSFVSFLKLRSLQKQLIFGVGFHFSSFSKRFPWLLLIMEK